MKKLINDVINKLSNMGVSYADVRYTNTDNQSIYFEKGILKNISTSKDKTAIGVRVLVDGCWGFAGTDCLKRVAIDNACQQAINNAKHGAKFRHQKVQLAEVSATQGSYMFTPMEDPFLISDAEKITYFEKIAKLLVGNEKIVHSYVAVSFYRQYKIYANSEGTFVDSLVYDTRPGMNVSASDGQHVLDRSWPGNMAGRRGGFEVVRAVEFEKNAERIIKEAIELLTAPSIDEEKADLIIGNSHLALQLHESAGHATEADRIFGMEISYAGKTFIKPEMLGKFRYGSEHVNIYSDSLNETGMGYHLVDDEGVPGRKIDIVKNGILMNQQTSREITPQLRPDMSLAPSSNMMASYANDIPLIRMTNFCLAPGDAGSLADLIENTERGYLLDFTKTWSIDDNRNNFQFTTQIGWRIVDGQIKGIVKEPTYYGITPEFWNSCDAICDESEWGFYGTFFCGKGEPGQAMHLSHGVAPARFKNVVCNVKA